MKWKIPVALAAVFVLSVLSALYLPVEPIIRDLAAVPAIGSLLAFLFTLLREHIAHDRAIFLQQLQSSSTIGATSHMATVAFDKHVAFAEEYFNAALEAVGTLMKAGPIIGALDLARKLSVTRQKWALWVTPEINSKLETFESPIWDIGLEMIIADAGAEDAHEARAKAFQQFKQFLGIGKGGASPDEQRRAQDRIAATLQGLLGTTELTRLRSQLVKNAATTVDASEQK